MKYMSVILTTICLLSLSCTCDKPVEPVGPTAPAEPTGLVLHSATKSSLTFQWKAVEGATGYGWTLKKGSDQVREGSETSRNVKIEELESGTTYRFSVCALGEEGLKSGDTSIDAKTLEEEKPVTPDPPAGSMSYEEFSIPAYEEDGVARAFPGAEGGGMFTTGGRGGKVIYVTNLNDSGAGSLRAAIGEKGARTIVFKVAGIIELQSPLQIKNGDVTIAGQTAPGDGICLKNYTLQIRTSNVIIRYIRCRMGDEKKTEDDAMNLNASGDDVSNVIVDHCSLSWCTDECASFYGMTGFTLQWCILSESLRNSIHDKGKHGYGGLWGGADATYHHNLLAHHDSRNPRLDHDYLSLLKGPVSIANNVIYNWGDNSTYGGESANNDNDYRKYNIVNNYYKPGPATASGKIRFLDPWTGACSNCAKKTGCSTIVPGHFYMHGNYMHGKSDLCADNWKGTTAKDETISAIKASTAFGYSVKESKISLQSAQDAFNAVLGYAGASLKRDSVDERITGETRNGNYTYEGSKGSSKGFIDTQADVKGWPEYSASEDELSRTADSDSDGMPDWWEEKAGLNKDSAADGTAFGLDRHKRYTNLEMYLHWLVREITAAQTAGGTYDKL